MIIINIKTAELINAVAWDPINAYEFSTISKDGLTFWILEEKSGTLQTHKPTTNVKEVTISINKILLLLLLCVVR